MNKRMECEKCGTEMNPYHEGATCGMLCPACGWGWVTTYSLPIDADNTMYTISFSKAEKVTPAMIKLYAKLAGINFLQAKRVLEEGSGKYVALEADIQNHISEIHAAGMQFVITPDYPYELGADKR